MRAFLLAIVLAVAACPVMANKLTLERIYDGGSLSGSQVRDIQISPDGKHVTFLRAKDDDQNTYDLWEYDLDGMSMHRLVDSATLGGSDSELSDAEKARRERNRTAGMHGIVSYHWSPDSSQLLIPHAGDLYLYSLKAAKGQHITTLDTGGDALDPKFSPQGHYVSYVMNQDLWAIKLDDGQATQLTHGGGGTVHNGQAEFVAQEEMNRHTGYWWAPDESAIAFEHYDAAQVPVTERMEIYADHTAVVPQRYPFAGDPNVKVKLGLVPPTGGTPRWINLGADQDIYLTRVKWLPDSKHLSYEWMPRSQQKLELRLVDAATLAQRVLLTETSDTWIDLNKDLRFLPDGKRFIWGSDRSGYHHLYLYDLDGKLEHAIGAGAWTIDGLLAVDAKNGLVYVSSNRDFVPDRQIYALKLDGSTADDPQRISQRDGTHEAVFSSDASIYVDTFSDPNTPPQVSVHRANGNFVTWIEENKLDEDHPYWPYMDSHVTPEYGHIKASDGQDLYYRVYKPLNFDPSKRYPVFDTFYGGPHAQTVKRDWNDYFNEYMAQQGFVVFSLDNRGMARRGRAFSDVIYHQFGVAEVEDQIAGIDWLKKQSWVDPGRIGVFGWSYGGYMTLMMLAKDSQDLAGGVAVAPVTNWHLYDTFYTERYLGLPQDNEAGYARSSPMAWLDGLTAPLMLAHGMADDNVLFLNSTELMTALQKRGIQFGLMTYPGGKHGLNLPGEQLHVHQLIADFFEHTVKGECAAKAAAENN